MKKERKKEYDVIVVGSGAAGCTVAREMTKKGKKVLLLEKGGRMEWLGTTATVASMIDIPTLLRNYKDIVIFVNNYGGASNIAAGCALPPPKKVFAPPGHRPDRGGGGGEEGALDTADARRAGG